MIPSAFDYYAANSVDEALKLLAEHGDEAKILAGGHSLLPAMKLRLAAPTVLIDINPIKELSGINVSGGQVRIGALTTYITLYKSEELKSACPVLGQCVAQIGDPQVRNRGTIGGALVHADPAADMPAVVLALGGSLSVQGPNGTREIDVDDFFVDMLTTALEPDELLTTISIPAVAKGSGAAYAKMVQPASGYAIVGAAAYVTLASDGTISSARVAVTGAGPKPTRQTALESALAGGASDEAAVKAASEHAGEDMDFLGDIHASEDYRRAMVKVYCRRALLDAIAAAKG
jgi:aerobic carbon-monoxide dehydrogenase medium subunit